MMSLSDDKQAGIFDAFNTTPKESSNAYTFVLAFS